MIKNATVVLTYKIDGALTHAGKYEYKERTTSGNMIEEDQRLFTLKDPQNSECYKRVTLSEAFVNHAISEEARPTRAQDIKTYTFWRKMSNANRLAYYVAKYVSDMGGTEYSYNILEE
jgi:hypothetical protein